ETGTLNPRGIATYTPQLADAVGAVLDRGEVPIVLGGDCSILMGPMLALRRRGRSGLVFVDGHSDFYGPEREPNGEAASMDLALVTGRGPAVLTDLEGRHPLVRDEDVVAFAMRDAGADPDYASDALPPALRAMDLTHVRRAGAGSAASAAVAHLARADGPASFWVHLDADVVDDAVMPAVDYRMPGGLSFAELEVVLATFRAAGRVVGWDITIFNPSLDPDGQIARSFTDSLIQSLGRASAR
ncbi:MAG: arginase family protein, partial [Gemmatimonadales bacterium]